MQALLSAPADTRRLQLPALPPYPLSHPRREPHSQTHKRISPPPFYPSPSLPPLLSAPPRPASTSQGKGDFPDRPLTDLHGRASPSSSATLMAARLTGTSSDLRTRHPPCTATAASASSLGCASAPTAASRTFLPANAFSAERHPAPYPRRAHRQRHPDPRGQGLNTTRNAQTRKNSLRTRNQTCHPP